MTLRSRAIAPVDAQTRPVPAPVRALVADMRFELVPTRRVDAAVNQLPVGAPVSVTCSPTRGIEPTLALTARLIGRGHHAVPHLSARLVESPAHVARLATWLRDHDVHEVFVIAGDSATPVGPYEGALAFLRALLDADQPLRRVGVAAYPDGHPLLDVGARHAALHAKQTLLAEAGVAGWVTTQMCFDGPRITRWLAAERAAGFTLRVALGIPGVVDRAALMSMGLRVGVGTSLRFLGKHRGSMVRLLASRRYDPTGLVASLADDAPALGIEGVHAFTFNCVGETAAWQTAVLEHD